MGLCANLLAYHLEQRARRDFVGGALAARLGGGGGGGGAQELLRLRAALDESLGARCALLWLLLGCLAGASAWQLACLWYGV
jgi:hypothetical protein